MIFPLLGSNVEVFDVTIPLSPGMTVWPGDAATEFAAASRIANGDPCNVSQLACSTHAGTHVDAPWHFEEAGARLDDIPAERWMGACLVVEATSPGGRISRRELEMADIPVHVERLVFKTRRTPRAVNAPFDPEYVALSPEAARWVVERGTVLIGIDSPSVEPFDDAAHEVHHTLLRAGVLIVEGLDLAAVEAGPYHLICLPLRLMDADGAPARALLVRTA